MSQTDRGYRCWNCGKTGDEPLVPAPETDSPFTVYVCEQCCGRIRRCARIGLAITVLVIIAQMIILFIL